MATKKALIAGITGQDGSYSAHILAGLQDKLYLGNFDAKPMVDAGIELLKAHGEVEIKGSRFSRER